MIRYLLDTNAVGDFINHRHGVPERVREARTAGAIIGTCEPVVAELFFGIENSTTRDENLQRLRQGLSRIRCWPLDRRASEEFGRLAVVLKRAGRVIGPIDVVIAAIALTLGDCTVVTNDKDFLSIPGLVVENWRTEAKEGTGS
jgi:tRNA(fMet)-specific endonuclease VapC